MTRGTTDHVWLVMMKAMRALTKYAAAGIEETGLGLSDFGVLEIPAAQRAFAGQYDRPDRRPNPRLDQYRCRPPRREGPCQPGRERRRPARADRCPHPARQGPHCF